jgi:hypothetical protein
MNLEGRTRLHLGAATNWLPRWLAVVFPFSIAGSVLGQGVLVPGPGYQGSSGTPQLGSPGWNAGPATAQGNVQANGQNNAAPATPEGENGENAAAPVGAPVQGLLRWGSLHVRTRASYQFLYSTGVHAAPGQSADTFTHTLSPGVTLDLGPHVSVDYSPSFRFFSQRDFHNTVDQFVTLTAGAGYGDWTFGVSQSFSRSDEPLVQTSGQTDTENYLTGVNASYRFNDKISLETSASVDLMAVGSNPALVDRTHSPGGRPITNTPPALLTDSQNYSATEWLNYTFDEKLNAGVGVTVGYSEQNVGFRSLDEQYLGRFTWTPGNKLNVSLNGGIEDQQFLNSGAPDIVNPIFSVSAGYHLFEQTSFSLFASRAVSASLFQSQITETAQVGLGFQQRLLGAVELSLGFAYGTSDYKTTAGTLATVRSDETTSYSVALGVPFLKHGSFGTFYEYTKNSSSAGGFGFGSSQAGATVSWAY